METSLESIQKHRVKLTVAITPQEAKPVLDVAYRHVGRSISVPGFRKGKIPRKVIEAQVGRAPVLQEFVEHALGEFYVKALREHDLAPIGEPEFDDLDIADVEGAGFRFSATVDVRPRLSFSEQDYKGLRIERPSVSVAENEVDEQLDVLRDRFAELEVVGHPARRGDYVVADIRASVHDTEIPQATGQDLLYEIGSGAIVPELDRELEGKRKGDILKVNAELPDAAGEHAGQEATFQVLVKEVKAKVLAQLDDDFAKTASEFDTLEELREDIRGKLQRMKEGASDAAIRDRALQVLIDRVDAELPERLVDQETEARVQSAERRAALQGATLEQALAASGVDELRFRSDARVHATRAIKADLALEAIARAEALLVGDDELDRAVQALAGQLGRSAKDVRRTLEKTGQITSLAGDIIRDKALDLVVEHAEVVDPEGSAGA